MHLKTTKKLYTILHRIAKITDISDSEGETCASESLSDSDDNRTVHSSLQKRRIRRKRLADYLRK